jgi:nitroimidazol reductase NimA-like FMN-containing flavoprotein (pyridoxamine 5'-phosphate oxidase superfamily)
MRRKEKEVTAREEIEEIILRCDICRLGMCADGEPYVVPLCFGYEKGVLYFHPAAEGKKLEVLRKNPRVCFELDTDRELVVAKAACGYGMKYRSVIGYGTASFVAEPAQKRAALDVMMRHYGAQGPFTYAEETLARVAVVKVEVESMTGKKSGY